jgi:NAD(P)-dependent dehydrogenase (short-subunit alcohol dehydrogenase family)
LGLGSHRDDVFGVAQRGGGVFGKVPYSSAKAAILGFTKSLARNWKTPA